MKKRIWFYSSFFVRCCSAKNIWTCEAI